MLGKRSFRRHQYYCSGISHRLNICWFSGEDRQAFTRDSRAGCFRDVMVRVVAAVFAFDHTSSC